MKPVAINFDQLNRPDKPNYYLACPKDKCNIKPDIETPCYNENVTALKKSILNYINQQPRYTLLSDSSDQLEYTQKSLLFRFPDYVTFRLYSYSQDKSSLAVLSYAKYGYYDFGVNENRVKAILEYLNAKSQSCPK